MSIQYHSFYEVYCLLLDVYKRQRTLFSSFFSSSFGTITATNFGSLFQSTVVTQQLSLIHIFFNSFRKSAVEPDVFVLDEPSSNPVSYTHLDVYKRQVIDSYPVSGKVEDQFIDEVIFLPNYQLMLSEVLERCV